MYLTHSYFSSCAAPAAAVLPDRAKPGHAPEYRRLPTVPVIAESAVFHYSRIPKIKRTIN
ncbi:MAG: hypothetical protein LBG87_08170 [Spirochaetaceae bacterium]|nr:hypothetical protein [Spirochaetaceae bacterium]